MAGRRHCSCKARNLFLARRNKLERAVTIMRFLTQKAFSLVQLNNIGIIITMRNVINDKLSKVAFGVASGTVKLYTCILID